MHVGRGGILTLAKFGRDRRRRRGERRVQSNGSESYGSEVFRRGARAAEIVAMSECMKSR